MGPYVDTYNIYFDCKGFGFGNVEMAQVLDVGNTLNIVYLGRVKRIFIINRTWLFSTLLTIAGPFFHPSTKNKLVYLDGSSDLGYAEELLQYFDLEEIPKDYGGHGPQLPTNQN